MKIFSVFPPRSRFPSYKRKQVWVGVGLAPLEQVPVTTGDSGRDPKEEKEGKRIPKLHLCVRDKISRRN